MPASSRTKHPHLDLTVTFTEADHRYVDSAGQVYVSASTLVKSAFAPFDEQSASKRVADREGRTVAAVLADWHKKRDDACDYGTRFHENVEATILGRPRQHPPRSEKEIQSFRVGVDTAKKLMARFGTALQPERVVFSPFFGVAGTIDLLAGKGDNFILFDWKTNEAIKRDGYDCAVVHGLEHVPNANFHHYAMALSTYELVLRREGYVPAAATIKRMLIHVAPGADKPEFIETPDMRPEVRTLLLERACEERVLKGA